jgi:uncharacterized protein YbaA (DUF1428 family)
MDRYVDGFVIPLPTKNIDDYYAVASKAGEIWKEHGALEYYECIADDLDAPDMVSFTQLAGAQEVETVIFSWIVYESREHRDKVNAAVMADPRMKDMMGSDKQIFDWHKMAYGGFKTLVRL